jgi:poly(A) polymerase
MTEPQTPISSKPPCSREDALLVLKRLRENGHVAYFAGGCVRDELLGIVPKDYDVATNAPPTRVRELFKNTQAVGAAFGVILVRQNKSVVEVATFRTDDVYLDGRRPSKVHFTTAQEDAKRRDFTINGLFFDPIENRVIDFVDGQSDLKNKILRAIGQPEARFGEDYLRLLRAVRFASRFDLKIEAQTAVAIRHYTSHLKSISPERIADELRLMLSPSTRNKAWELLNEFDLINVIFRFSPPATAKGDDPARSIFLHLGEKISPFGLTLAAASVSRQKDILPLFPTSRAREIGRAMRQALRISNDESDDLENSLAGIGIILNGPTLTAKKRFLARPTSDLSRRLMCAIVAAGIMRQVIEPIELELAELQKTDYAPAPFITGNDLIAAGLEPGKLFKRILNDVYDAQLESRVNSKQQAMELALQIAKAG